MDLLPELSEHLDAQFADMSQTTVDVAVRSDPGETDEPGPESEPLDYSPRDDAVRYSRGGLWGVELTEDPKPTAEVEASDRYKPASYKPASWRELIPNSKTSIRNREALTGYDTTTGSLEYQTERKGKIVKQKSDVLVVEPTNGETAKNKLEDGEIKTIVIAGGITTDGGSYIPYIKHMADLGYRVICIDYPHHLRPNPEEIGKTQEAAFAALINVIFDNLDNEDYDGPFQPLLDDEANKDKAKIGIVGHSRGSWTAMATLTAKSSVVSDKIKKRTAAVLEGPMLSEIDGYRAFLAKAGLLLDHATRDIAKPEVRKVLDAMAVLRDPASKTMEGEQLRLEAFTQIRETIALAISEGANFLGFLTVALQGDYLRDKMAPDKATGSTKAQEKFQEAQLLSVLYALILPDDKLLDVDSEAAALLSELKESFIKILESSDAGVFERLGIAPPEYPGDTRPLLELSELIERRIIEVQKPDPDRVYHHSVMMSAFKDDTKRRAAEHHRILRKASKEMIEADERERLLNGRRNRETEHPLLLKFVRRLGGLTLRQMRQQLNRLLPE